MAAAEKALREQVREQVVVWLEQDGLTTADGVPDLNEIRGKVALVLTKRAIVSHKSERADKAITAGPLAHAVAPGLALLADQYESMGDVEQTAYATAVDLVWKQTAAAYNSHMQRMIGEILPGHVLCRVKIGIGEHRDQTWVAYVTDDEELILADFARASQTSAQKAQDKMAHTLALVGERKPELAAKAESMLKRSLRSSGEHAREVFQLRLAATTGQSTTD